MFTDLTEKNLKFSMETVRRTLENNTVGLKNCVDNSRVVCGPDDVEIPSSTPTVGKGYRRIKSKEGISYKKIFTSQIMDLVVLGIQRSIGTSRSAPDRDVLMSDFMTVESTPFSSVNAESRQIEFVFKTYAPVAFKHLRDLFGIVPDKFSTSFSHLPLVELKNAGASGSDFYLTRDDKFIVKTVQHREADFLQKLLPGYFLNLSQNPHTLLPKFVGFYSYKRRTTNVRFVVMNNVLPSSIKIHQKYDLKGSTYMRQASKTELGNEPPTYKDLDFIRHHPNGIILMGDVYKSLVKTIQRDCRVLESFRIVDYSFLLGVHYLDRDKNDAGFVGEDKKADCENVTSSGDGAYIRYEANNLTPRNLEGKNLHGGVELAENDYEKKNLDQTLRGIPAKTANGENLLLFVGIIDILQSYGFKKKAEHFFKSIIHESDSISVHNPAFYAKRYEEFLKQRVFKICPLSSKNTHDKF